MADAPTRSLEVVIAGAGIAGIATAWSLAERGVERVTLVDPRPPLSLTSNRPEANHRSWWPHPTMVELERRSLEMVERLRAEGDPVALDWRGYLFVSDDPATARSLPDLVARHPAAAASDAAVVAADELRRRWPHLGPRVEAGVLVRKAGGLDTVALGRAMLARAVGAGLRVVGGRVSGVVPRGGRVSGVRVSTADGRVDLRADVLVDAAGPFARDVARFAGADLPVETLLREKVVIRDREGVVPRDAPFTITLDGRSLAWSGDERARLANDPQARRLLGPLPPGLHVKPDDTSGPDAVKLGWAWDQTPSEPLVTPACPPDFPRMVLLGAATFIPGLAPYAERVLADPGGTLIAHDGGFYARTPDGRPLVGPVGGGPDGLFAAAGLAGFGAMMATAVGELAAEWIVAPADAAARPDADAFDPRRFDDPAYRAAIATGAVATGEL